MRAYIMFIKGLQNTLVGGSVLYLMTAPIVLSLFPELVPASFTSAAFTVSLAAVTFVMSIRPLADLFPKARWLRSLVILRKGFGVTSASIIIGFVLGRIMSKGLGGYFAAWLDASYWSLAGYALFAHLGDVTGFILLATSNNFSKRILGPWWKRVQKLAYVYFYTGASYEAFAFGSTFAWIALVLVSVLVTAAFIRNRFMTVREPAASPVQTPAPQAMPARQAPAPSADYTVRVSNHHTV